MGRGLGLDVLISSAKVMWTLMKHLIFPVCLYISAVIYIYIYN